MLQCVTLYVVVVMCRAHATIVEIVNRLGVDVRYDTLSSKLTIQPSHLHNNSDACFIVRVRRWSVDN